MNEQVTVVRIDSIRPHPTQSERFQLISFHVGEDTITLVTGIHYAVGELGFYMPPGAIIPDKLADEMELLGRLGGSKKNKVRARNMGGIPSEGIFYGECGPSWNNQWVEGQDITNEVGITF